MHYLNKGKRGIVYLTRENGRQIVVKKERPGSHALRALHNEAFWLQTLNKHKIGPRFIRFDDHGLAMEYIKGILFVDWHQHHQGKDGKRIIKDIFLQCRTLDKLRVNKLEMHSPLKHILIRRGKAILIDFERCKRTLRPKNVTQFCQFLLSLGCAADRERLKMLLRMYKQHYDKQTFQKIIHLFIGF